MDSAPESLDHLIDHLGLSPMPLEGGLFRRLWRGPEGPDGRPSGSAIIVLLSRRHGTFSAMHRLPFTEVWHFYLGGPLDLLLLSPGGGWEVVQLGPDLRAGQHVQYTVPAGTWMGARIVAGAEWSLFGCTMAPGFVWSDYEGAGPELAAEYPAARDLIGELIRPGAPLRHPAGSDDVAGPAGTAP